MRWSSGFREIARQALVPVEGLMTSFHSAETVEKLLDRTKRCLVKFLGAVQQMEANAEFIAQRFCVIAHHIKTAALRRALGPERADNHVSSRLDRLGGLPNIGDVALYRGQKMKYCTVVPHIVSRMFQLGIGDVRPKPLGAF